MDGKFVPMATNSINNAFTLFHFPDSVIHGFCPMFSIDGGVWKCSWGVRRGYITLVMYAATVSSETAKQIFVKMLQLIEQHPPLIPAWYSAVNQSPLSSEAEPHFPTSRTLFQPEIQVLRTRRACRRWRRRWQRWSWEIGWREGGVSAPPGRRTSKQEETLKVEEGQQLCVIFHFDTSIIYHWKSRDTEGCLPAIEWSSWRRCCTSED